MKIYREQELQKAIALNLIIFILSLYMITASMIHHSDQSALRYDVTENVVEKHDLSVSNGNGVQGKDGRYYSYYGLGSSALAVPFYVIGKVVGGASQPLIYFMQLMFGAVTVSVIFLFCVSLGYSLRSSLVAALFYGVGSMAWPLAKQPFEHVTETLFVVLSVYYLYQFSLRNKIIHLVLSAVCFGISLNIRLTSLLIVPSLFIVGVVPNSKCVYEKKCIKTIAKHMFVYSLVVLPFVFLVFWYNYYRFGSIYETGFQLIARKTGIDFFSGTNLLTGLRGFLLSPGKGIFYYSPVAILFFPAIIPFYRRHPKIASSFILAILAYILFLSKNIYWHGDWCWGPRYLLAILPFLIIPSVEILEPKKNFAIPFRWKTLIYVIFAIGVIIQLAAVSVDCYKYFFDLNVGKGTAFIVNKGIGAPDIVEPPDEVHFEWKLSPILAQFRSIDTIGRQIHKYKAVPFPKDGDLSEKLKAYPPMHLYDYWWLYLYYVNGIRTGFLVVAALFGVCSISGYRLMVTSRLQQ